MLKDHNQDIPIVAAANEMADAAAKLSVEARYIEKSNDTVTRTPHMGDCSTVSKSVLLEKPQ